MTGNILNEEEVISMKNKGAFDKGDRHNDFDILRAVNEPLGEITLATSYFQDQGKEDEKEIDTYRAVQLHRTICCFHSSKASCRSIVHTL